MRRARNYWVFGKPAESGCGQNPNNGPHTVGAWLNGSAFSRVIPDPNYPVQQFGTAGGNIALGPRYWLSTAGTLLLRGRPSRP